MAMSRLRERALSHDESFMTPWEQDAAPEAIVRYELEQIRRSVENVGQLFRT